MRRVLERHAGLLEDLRGDHLIVVLDDSAGIDQLEFLAAMISLAADPVARDAGLVADDRAALSEDGIEQRRFADVGAADDDDGGKGRHETSLSQAASARTRQVATAPA